MTLRFAVVVGWFVVVSVAGEHTFVIVVAVAIAAVVSKFLTVVAESSLVPSDAESETAAAASLAVALASTGSVGFPHMLPLPLGPQLPSQERRLCSRQC